MDLNQWTYPDFPIPDTESQRLQSLAEYDILDADENERFDRVTKLAAQLLGMPMCAISLIDEDRQFFLSHHGFDARETPREEAFCNYVVAGNDTFVVNDATEDQRFQNNPLVNGDFHLRFYAGVPILNDDGVAVGSLCVLDNEAHDEGITADKEQLLKDLAAVVINEITARMTSRKYQLESELRREAMVEIENQRQEAVAHAKFKSEFLANMSHEIRTPLNGVIGIGELLRETELDSEQADYLDTLLTSADSLLNIINDVLDISKLEAGQMHYETIEFCLKNEVEQVAEVLAQKATQKNVDLAVEVDPSFPTAVIGDPTRVSQILYNLAGNSVKFTESGYVCIRLKPLDEQFVQIDVEDSGIGMSAEQIETLFEKFSQADTSITRKYGGTGLGMSIVAQLIEAFEGSIDVSSELGKGTCVSIKLRLPQAPDAVCDMRLEGGSLEGARILVVDDIELNRNILKTMLESHHAEVVTAIDGFDAIAAVERSLSQQESYDCVVCDHHMPGFSGADLVTRVRSSASELPIIVLTSGGHSSDLKDVAPDRVLHKPARAKQLIPAIQTLISKAHPQPQNSDPQPETAPESEPEVQKTARTQPEATEKSKESGSDDRPFDGLSILVAEDNTTNQLVIKKLLKKLGCDNLRIANHGKEVVDMYHADPSCDLILMDIQMPEMSGIDAQKAIRLTDLERGHSLPIIALTANAVEGDRERFMEDGFSGYCSKPIRRPDLINAIESCLS